MEVHVNVTLNVYDVCFQNSNAVQLYMYIMSMYVCTWV